MTTKLPIIAGIFEFIFACLIFFMSSMGVILSIQSIRMPPIAEMPIPQLSLIVFGLIASIFGFISGIFTVKRRHFILSIFGVIMTAIWSFYLVLYLYSAYLGVYYFEEVMMSGYAFVLLSIISLALLLSSKAEFK